uniref:Eukaryotic translation initiation factor 5A n=1 Tax=Euplotes harpa TaxID=151035 RepID=A0A7S3JBR7_9SPIT|mmetsp:Transcript_26565/g.30684  ORF Transcript_26565/g.30684 Transcript_26565/m.30684 type:complete len:151 (+) Transcript_26565:40-492(+)
MEEERNLDRMQAGHLTKGSFIMMGDKPSRVTKISKAKPGKHGAAKAIIVAVGVLDDKKVEKTFGTSDMVDVPILKRTEYPLLGIEDGFLQLQTEGGEMRDDIKLSERECFKDVNENIMKFHDEDIPALITILSVYGQEIPIAVREDTTEI